MRPIEFPHEAIVEAGQSLQARGRNVTGFALRQLVGGGNASRLKQVWDEYLNGLSVVATEPVADLPVEVSEQFDAMSKALLEKLNSLVVGINDKAVKSAERRVAEIVKAAGEQRVATERELADASMTVDDLEMKWDEAKARIDLLSSDLAQSQAKAQAQAIELAQLSERLGVAEQVAEQLRADLAAQLKAAQAFAYERDQARLEGASLAGQIASLHEQNAALLARLAQPATT